jgi:glycosyltransferase involved in cell wall biosynthesis
LSKELNAEDVVWFYGACYDEEKLAELLYNADLCVSPGNVGLTAMHSMVYGLPVLTHNKFEWQMPEFEAIIEGKTGSFFEYDNLKSLETSISGFFKNVTDRETIRKNCFAVIDSKFNPHIQLNVIRNVLEI